jgi:hypothetical protein
LRLAEQNIAATERALARRVSRRCSLGDLFDQRGHRGGGVLGFGDRTHHRDAFGPGEQDRVDGARVDATDGKPRTPVCAFEAQAAYTGPADR